MTKTLSGVRFDLNVKSSDLKKIKSNLTPLTYESDPTYLWLKARTWNAGLC